MQWLAKVSVKRPVFATVLILVICVVGVTGYLGLGVDRFPKVELPMVMVMTQVPGAAPKEIESDVTNQIEEAVNTISGIEELTSMSNEGLSIVYVQFALDKDIDVAAQEVRDRVNTVVGDLPLGAEPPVIQKLDPDATPVLFISVKADKPIREITEVADKVLVPRLENVSGVGQISIIGGRERQINVILDPVKLRSLGLTAADVQRVIAGQNVTMPGGNLDSGPTSVTLRIAGRVTSPGELAELVIRNTDDHPIRVRDVGAVEDGEAEAESAALRDGVRAVVLSVRKQSGENTVAVVDAVRKRMDEMARVGQIPSGYSLAVERDESATIRTSVAAVQEHLLLGALFASLVVLLFLGNLRSTIIAAIAIPVSVIGTFGLMRVMGFTLDNITLLALALAVGIVIDDAIVVLENIWKHIDEKGMRPFQAAVQATNEIGLAVLATTMSLIAVFVPVAFMTGIVGRFLKSFGLTMAFSIAVSLVVSFTLTPMMAARWLRKAPHGGKKPVLERMVDVFYRPIERSYMAILGFVMRHRWVVVVASFATLAATGPLMKAAPADFLPESDEAHFLVNVRAPEGTSLEATTLIAERVARAVRGLDGVSSTLLTTGDNLQKLPNLGSVYVKLTHPEARKATQKQIMNRVRQEIVARQPKELRIDVSEVPMFTGGMTWLIAYELTGPDLDQLIAISEKVHQALKDAPGQADATSTYIPGKPEVQVTILREKAADLGVSVSDIAMALRLLVGGLDVSSYHERGEEYDIHLVADRAYRADAAGLALVTVPSSKLGSVPLTEVVRMEEAVGPSQIDHSKRRRKVSMFANVAPGSSEGAVAAAFLDNVKKLDLPPGYTLEPFGRTKEMARSQQTFLAAFALAFIFMYLILAAQLESWLHPITILLSLPLTLPFAVISIILFGQSLNIFSILGVLVLFGVIKKNAILQIDHINGLRAKGMARAEAILLGNRDRLKPILMTTLAFVAGMVPLLFSKGIGAGFNRATAGGIVGGQVLSLLLTLLATPVAYSLFDDASAWLRRKLFRRRPEDDDGGERLLEEAA
jgi:hydrophobe/amphiphile efflux-1 (HAE1) family protein